MWFSSIYQWLIFFHLFLKGLIEENFKETFPTITLKEDIININDKYKIKELINMTRNLDGDIGVIGNDIKDVDNKKFKGIKLADNTKNINKEEVNKSPINLECENIQQGKVSNNMEEIKEENNIIVNLMINSNNDNITKIYEK